MSRQVPPEPQCRLCLQHYPEPQLVDIFSSAGSSDYRMHIQRAVFVHVFETDSTTRFCANCRTMVELIVAFQRICRRVDLLLAQEGGFEGGSWKNGSKAVEGLWKVVELFREEAFDEIGEEVQEVVEEQGFELVSVINDHLGQPSDNEEVIEALEEVKEEDLSEAEDKKEPTDQPWQPYDAEEWEVEAESEESDEIPSSTEEVQSEDDTPKPRAKRGRPKKDPNNVEWQPPDIEADETESDASSNYEPAKRTKKGHRKRNSTDQSAPKEQIMCDTCGQLVSKAVMEGHTNRHLGIKPFVCDIEGCGSTQYSRHSLRTHRLLHRTLNEYHDCPICHKRLKGTGNWHRHKRMHMDKLRHSCDVCGKTFRKRSYLKLHAVVHTGATDFACEICGKRFGIKHNLGTHYKRHAKKGEFREGTQEPELTG